ncbi:MAG: F0F1 ATP synthase subunit A [Acidimicrobiia bacterium]
MLALEFPSISHLFDWPAIWFDGSPLAVNKTVLLLWVTVILVAGMFLTAARKPGLVPSGVRNVVEAGVEFIEKGVAREVMGAEGAAWVPFLTTMFFFILFLNLFGIIPLIQFPATSRMAIPGFLAIQTWLVFLFVGIKRQGFFRYFKNSLFPPGVPIALYFLVVPIEFLSTFIVRPFSLAVRLFANMMAGHLLLVSFYVIAAALWSKSIAVVILPLPVVTAIALTGFELLVVVLQAYIFTILTAVYIGQSIHPEH